jgi:hypothetical protein
MVTFFSVMGTVGFVFSLVALWVALVRKEGDPSNRVKRLQLELIELADLVDAQAMSLKKLHGRAASRAAREDRHESPAIDPNDPMARLPGETGEQWKARMGRTLTGIRRN